MVKKNTGLVWSIVKRFLNRGAEAEDLFQIGSIGLLKAIDKFDLDFQVRFSTYAVPMISGGDPQISPGRRAFEGQPKSERNRGQRIRGPGSAGEKTGERACPEGDRRGTENFSGGAGYGPGIQSGGGIFAEGDLPEGEGNEISLMDRLREKTDAGEQVLNRLMLEELLESLPKEERRLLYLRYFQEETQSRIAERMGISQVQVSRLEKKILQKLKKKAESR